MYIGDFLVSVSSEISGIYRVNDGTKVIASGAFENCDKLEAVYIPLSVTNIGQSAFIDCNSLCELTVPFIGADVDGEFNASFGVIFGTAKRPDSLISISSTIPKSLKKVTVLGGTSVSDRAFYGCANISEIILPSTIETIGNYAFGMCTSLSSIIIPDNVTKIGLSVFEGCIFLNNITVPFLGGEPSADASLAYFWGSSSNLIGVPESLSKVTLTGCCKLGENAFNDCRYVKEIVLPDTLTEIGAEAFRNCFSLTALTIPDSVESIGHSAFVNCIELSSVNVPYGVKKIESYTFFGCDALEKIVIPESVTEIGSYAFSGCKFPEFNIPSKVTVIGQFAFSGCAELVNITVPNSVTEIGWGAFMDCEKLSFISLPFVGESADSKENAYLGYIFRASQYTDTSSYVPISLKRVELTGSVSIAYRAFFNCFYIEEISLPKSVTSIEVSAFKKCTSLKNIRYSGTIKEWNAITKDDSWTNGTTNGFTVHCADGEVKYAANGAI